MKNKVLLAIADGLGDRPCDLLGGKTPLEAARKEHLNTLAKEGSSGIMDLHECGTPVGTDLGHMILFGYSLHEYPGRGPIEAFGAGVELQAGDVAFRANFATVDEHFIVTDRRAGRIRKGTRELAQALHGMQIEDVTVLFKEATEHRAVLVLRGPGLAADVTDSDPKKEGLAYKPVTANSPASEKTARIMQTLQLTFYEILSKHPINQERVSRGEKSANFILTRGAGLMPHIVPKTEELGFKAACIAAEGTVLGMARLAGFTPMTDVSFTGNLDTNVEKKARMAVDALKDYDLVVMHMKAPDLMGHDNNPLKKVEAIEKYDAMVGYAMEYSKEITDANVIFALAADHSTPCERMEHSGDPVPVVVSGKNIRKDDVSIYDEMQAAKGGLCRISGHMFTYFLLDYLEVTKKEGN